MMWKCGFCEQELHSARQKHLDQLISEHRCNMNRLRQVEERKKEEMRIDKHE